MNKLKVSNLKRIDFSSSFKSMRQYKIDILIVIALAIAIMIFTYLGTHRIPDPIFTDFYAQDVWFGSDIPTIFGNITSFSSDFGRNNKHPLFPLFVFPFVYGIGKLLHLEPISAVRLLIVIIAGVWIGSLYVLFRFMGCHRLDATLLSLLGGVSAASMFWIVTPESFPLGSLTILLGLGFVTLTQYRSFSSIWYVAINVLTVSITITNSMVGIFATLINHRWKKALQVGVVSLLVATGLWILQRIVFTNSGFPFQPGTFIGEKKFMAAPDHHGILGAVSSLFYQTIVMPTTQLLESPIRPDWVKLDANTLAPASGGVWGTVAVFCWTGLLLLGLWGFFSIKQHPKLRVVLGLTLAVQVLMHSVYGLEETFIYSLHFAPLLLTLAALSFLTPLRPFSLVLTTILIISAGINNSAQFHQITTALWNYGTPQQRVIAQMKLRPTDPWPRSAGHVILASIGSSIEHKAFHEPGGSFSPQPGSFGVSIWMLDKQGKLKATSDSLPLSEIQQQFIDSPAQKPPGISTKTAYYQSSWSAAKAGSWQLDLRAVANSDSRPMVVIRSVGPAGGAIQSLDWNGERLLINDRWSINNIPKTAKVYLGSETTSGWVNQQSILSQWKDPTGWGYARIGLDQGESWNLVIQDNAPEPEATPPLNRSSNLALNLPNSPFVDSLNAQITHLLMGLVGTRTHPSDPISYPLPRFRDGAYQMVALARAGQLDVAKQLSTYFAENDFFNSTIPEADIPALGIWALEEVAVNLSQPDYDRWLWPHVRRKAELIMNMMSSHRPGYPVLEGTKIPFSEYPDFIRVDLLAGKMNNMPDSISLDPAANIMSYRALLDAATLADRVSHPEDAKRWRAQAEQTKSVWQKSNQSGLFPTTTGLWPSWMASDQKLPLTQALQQSWDASRDATGAFRQKPESLQRAIAQTHQWLLLNQSDRVWSTLKWFWDNQASPGLYTWLKNDEKSSEMPMPQSFSQWHRIRGWINQPQRLTPHYWTAAEMLLLQLEMLTYVDQSSSSPTLVIGAGIPPVWLTQPIGVKGQRVAGRLVNWVWDGKQINVQIKGNPINVKLGSSFPANTPMSILRD